MKQYRIGVDIGGTFTDFTIFDTQTSRLSNLKTPTVRAAPAEGVLRGLDILRTENGLDPEKIDYFVHGTTIAVNTLIEREGARLGLLVTKGFRDLLIIQRLRMPTPHNWRTGRPEPLVPRRHVYEITERLGPDGTQETPLSEADLDAALAHVRAEGLDGLVICFLHSYRNSAHEMAAKEYLLARVSDLNVTCSSEIWPRMREYERAVISIINAYVAPRVGSYLGALQARLREIGVESPPYITQSSGGIMTAASACLRPAETLLSGPAAGVIGAVQVAQAAGVQDFITLDVGGTSADVAFVNGGRPQLSQNERVADFPLMMPVIGVSSIGAGGGSVVWIDDSGVPKVGPASVGTDPGPACYGRGGEKPAITDAFLIGGMLNPATFAGGRIALSQERAREALAPVSAKLGRNEDETVDAVLRVAVAAIYAEISNLAARHGVSVRDFSLLPFGGAGPLLACAVADELGMTRILIPPAPGTLCSLGALSADVSKMLVHSVAAPLSECLQALPKIYDSLREEAATWLRAEAPWLTTHQLILSADMRYVGQSYEIDVDLSVEDVLAGRAEAINNAFHTRHQQVFAHHDAQAPVEVVDLRLQISGVTPKADFSAQAGSTVTAALAPVGARDVVLNGSRAKLLVYDRDSLGVGTVIEGPALVDENDSTLLIASRWRAEAHHSGSLLLQRID